MPKKGKSPPPAPEKERTFRRALWKHCMRYFGLGVLVLLNVTMVWSNVRLRMMHRMDLGHEILSYAVVLVFDVLFLLPNIFEVNSVSVTPDRLILGTLLWRARIPWSEIVSLKKPIWLVFAIVRTRRCFYLLNSRDLKDFAELMEIIQFQMGKVVRSCSQ